MSGGRWRGLARRAAMAPGAVYALILLSLIFSVFAAKFLTLPNLANVGIQASVLIIVALGMTLIILSEGIDLSLGSVLGLAGVILAMCVKQGMGLGVAIPLAILVGVGFGVINGGLITGLGLPPFVVTLGTFGMAQGLTLVLTEGRSIPGLGDKVQYFNEGWIAGIPVPVVLTAAAFLVVSLILYHTSFGTYIFALGGNETALALAGVRTRLYKTGVYALGGALAGVGALIMTARMNTAHPTMGIGLEFDAIAAVILGGTSFERGKGGLAGTLIGAAAVSVLRNGLNLIGVSSSWQLSTVGTVIILAIVVDALRGI